MKKTNPKSTTYTTKAKRGNTGYIGQILNKEYPYYRDGIEYLSLRAGNNLVREDRWFYKNNPTQRNLEYLREDVSDHQANVKQAAKDIKKLEKKGKK